MGLVCYMVYSWYVLGSILRAHGIEFLPSHFSAQQREQTATIR